MVLKKLLVFAAVGLLCLPGGSDSCAEQFRDGDIIFQTSRSEQSIAIQKATRSQYSHMGIVFFRNGNPYVYEAIKTVQCKWAWGQSYIIHFAHTQRGRRKGVRSFVLIFWAKEIWALAWWNRLDTYAGTHPQ